MANKFKLFVGFLALMALFSVYSFLNSFGPSSSVTKTANILKNSMSFEVDSDTDKDGLKNRDESYWNTDFQNPDTDGDGYLDGEEVASGHDPLIPGPNDLLNNGNLTDKLSKLTLSGLYEGSLRPDSPNYEKSLNDLTLAVIDDAIKSLNPEISTDQLQVISSSKENQTRYIKEISPILDGLLSTYLFEVRMISKNINTVNNYNLVDEYTKIFKTQSQKYDEYYQSGLRITPPKNWGTNHAGLLKLLRDLTETNLAISNNKTDPVRAMVAMDRLVGFFDIIPKLIESYSEKIKSQEINTASTFFEK